MGLLDAAIEILQDIQHQTEQLHSQIPTLETAAVRDAAVAGFHVALAAKANNKSIGAHCIVDDNDNTFSTSSSSSIPHPTDSDEEELVDQVADMR